MTKRTPEKLLAALELIEAGITHPTKIARGIDTPYRTYCKWLVRSNAGDPAFMVTYNDEPMQWAAAVRLAGRLAGNLLRGQLLEECVFGYPEILTFQGQIVWAIDPAAAAIPDPETRVMLGYRADALKEENGALVPATVMRRAPWAQQEAFLKSQFSEFRPTSTVNQNVNVRGGMTLGVSVAPRTDYGAKMTIPAAPPIPLAPPMVEVLGDVDPEIEDMLDLTLSEENLVERAVPIEFQPPFNFVGDTTGEVEPLRPVVEIKITAEPEPEPEPEPTPAPVPVAIDEAPKRQPRNALERDLFAKLEAARNKPKDGSAANV